MLSAEIVEMAEFDRCLLQIDPQVRFLARGQHPVDDGSDASVHEFDHPADKASTSICGRAYAQNEYLIVSRALNGVPGSTVNRLIAAAI